MYIQKLTYTLYYCSNLISYFSNKYDIKKAIRLLEKTDNMAYEYADTC